MRVVLPLVVLALWAAAAGPAAAHGTAEHEAGDPAAERALRAEETSTLGAAHARAHASDRAFAARVADLSRSERLAVARDLAGGAGDTSSPGGRPDEVGRWNLGQPSRGTGFGDDSETRSLPSTDYAVHATLLATGKVLLFGPARYHPTGAVEGWANSGEGTDNAGAAALWDPTVDPAGLTQAQYVDRAFQDLTPKLPQVTISATADGSRSRRVPLYCSAAIPQPDGSVLVVGGNLDVLNRRGLPIVYRFDPFTTEFHREPAMAFSRWYPTSTLLPSGRNLILSGYDEGAPASGSTPPTQGRMVDDAEVWPALDSPALEPRTGRTDRFGTDVPTGSADQVEGRTPEDARGFAAFLNAYPDVFLVRDGRLVVAGQEPNDTRVSGTPTDPRLPGPLRRIAAWPTTMVGEGNSSVPLPGGTAGPHAVLTAGGSGMYYAPFGSPRGTPPPVRKANAGVGVLDALLPNADPTMSGHDRTDDDLRVARSNHQLVLLPDGDVASIGGGGTAKRSLEDDDGSGTTAGIAKGPNNPDRRRVEIRDAATGRWRLGPAQDRPRAYHSVALLLPDGRVLSTGDDLNELLADPDYLAQKAGGDRDAVVSSAEVWTPPYLLERDGSARTRPTITAAPRWVAHGQRFVVRTPEPEEVGRAVMMAPGSATHSKDMSQRHVELAVVDRGPDSVVLQAPPDGAAMPPSYEMLFLLDRRGTPSVSRMVRLGAAEPEGRVGADAAGFDAGTVRTGRTADGTVAVRNDTAQVQTLGFAVTGTGFALAPGQAADRTLAPGASTDVAVRFAPTAAGASTGALTTTAPYDGAAGATVVAPLRGTGARPPATPTTPTPAPTTTPARPVPSRPATPATTGGRPAAKPAATPTPVATALLPAPAVAPAPASEPVVVRSTADVVRVGGRTLTRWRVVLRNPGRATARASRLCVRPVAGVRLRWADRRATGRTRPCVAVGALRAGRSTRVTLVASTPRWRAAGRTAMTLQVRRGDRVLARASLRGAGRAAEARARRIDARGLRAVRR